MKGQYIFVGRSTVADDLPLISAGLWIQTPVIVADSVLGADRCSIQLNICGDKWKFQNVLIVAPDELSWACEILDLANTFATDRRIQIHDYNTSDLHGALLRFYMSKDPFEMGLELRGVEFPVTLSRDIPGKYFDSLRSAYIAIVGAGGGSKAWMQTPFSAKIDYMSDPNTVRDLTAFSLPPPVGAIIPNVVLTQETSNLYQLLQLNVPGQITVLTAPGSWM